jgi:F-type H+-transporting ATPase subunit epsilon
MPTVTALDVGLMSITVDGKERGAFHSEGFMEVRPDCTVVLAQACEWPEEIDVKRAEGAKERAEKRLRKPKDEGQVVSSRIAQARALNRIKLADSGWRKLNFKEQAQMGINPETSRNPVKP